MVSNWKSNQIAFPYERKKLEIRDILWNADGGTTNKASMSSASLDDPKNLNNNKIEK